MDGSAKLSGGRRQSVRGGSGGRKRVGERRQRVGERSDELENK